MKIIIKISLALVTLIGLPLPALAWPMTLHDDGQYQALAVAAAGKLIVAAVATPATVELTIASASGQRLGWSTQQLPEQVWNLPYRKISLQVEQVGPMRYRLIVVLLAGSPSSVSAGYRYQIAVVRSSSGIQFATSEPASIPVPNGATDASVWWHGSQGYLVWQTQDEDGIATVRLSPIR